MMPASYWKRLEFETDGFPKFSSRAAKSLQQILFSTGAKIVLTTWHKYSYSLRQWKSIFKTRGLSEISTDKLQENTPFFKQKGRDIALAVKKHIKARICNH